MNEKFLPKYITTIAIFCMMAATLMYAIEIIVFRLLLGSLSPIWITILGFLLAGLVSPFFFSVKKFTQWKDASVAGVLTVISVFFQILSVKYTTVAKSAFIVSTSVLFVPLLRRYFDKSPIPISVWSIIFLSLIGVGLMSRPTLDAINFGDILALVSAIFFSVQLTWLEYCLRRTSDLYSFTFAQSLLSGAAVIPVALIIISRPNFDNIIEVTVGNITVVTIICLIYMAFGPNLFAHYLQNLAQKKIKAYVAGLILLMQAPFVAFLGWIFLHETLDIWDVFGGIVITSSVFTMSALGTRAKGEGP